MKGVCEGSSMEKGGFQHTRVSEDVAVRHVTRLGIHIHLICIAWTDQSNLAAVMLV